LLEYATRKQKRRVLAPKIAKKCGIRENTSATVRRKARRKKERNVRATKKGEARIRSRSGTMMKKDREKDIKVLRSTRREVRVHTALKKATETARRRNIAAVATKIVRKESGSRVPRAVNQTVPMTVYTFSSIIV
jgi:hypothetical protein